jgi:hypothetical protein
LTALRRASPRVSGFIAMRRAVLILEVAIGERLTVRLADAEAVGGFVDGPGRREAAPLY